MRWRRRPRQGSAFGGTVLAFALAVSFAVPAVIRIQVVLQARRRPLEYEVIIIVPLRQSLQDCLALA